MYQNRKQLFQMVTISTHTDLKTCGHSSIELHNTSTGKSAAAFRRDDFKLSILGCLFLQSPLPWTELGLPAGLATAHTARKTQKWQETNVPDFMSTSDWPSASLDLNPLDYKQWSKLQEMACKQRHPNIESLKQSLQKAAADFPVNVLCNSIDGWPQRLKDCVCANRGHFE